MQNPQNPPEPPSLPEGDRSPETTLRATVIPYRPHEPQRGRGGCFWFTVGGLGCLALLTLPVVVALVMGFTTVNSLVGGITGIFGVQQPATARVTTTQTIINSVQPLGQLVSISAQLAKADITIGIQQGPLNSCGFSANHVAQGTVEAGIDLTQMDEGAISYDALTNTYTIVLPPPRLTSCRIDFIRQYNRSFTACAVDWDEARLLADYTALIDFRNDAIEGGILQRARQEVRLIITNFVQALTGGNVEIIFGEEDLNGTSFPSSCAPDIPQRWSFDEQRGEWLKR